MQHPFGAITKAVVLFDAVQGPDPTSKEYADVLPAG